MVAREQLTRGLVFQLNYTWSKCLTNNQGYYGRYGNAVADQTTADVAFQSYVHNIRLDYGLCDADLTNNFKGDVNYDLPFGHNRSFGKNANEVVDAVL